MNKDFLKLMMEKTGFPQEAKTELERCFDVLIDKDGGKALDDAVKFYYENDFDTKLTEPLLKTISEESGVHLYTVWLLFLIEAAVDAKKLYESKGISEEIFFATFEDLKYKLYECRNVHGVWGNFVGFWYPIFYKGDIVKLGRLEYESHLFEEETPYTVGDFTIKKDDPVVGIHIPSSGEPFDKEARLESYKKAYKFFEHIHKGGPLVMMCYSWLLYPPYKQILSPTSNIVSFTEDFDILRQIDEEKFGDRWRVYGAEAEKPDAELPENTSMQRAFKKYILSGGKAGEGVGIIVFDGEKIINC